MAKMTVQIGLRVSPEFRRRLAKAAKYRKRKMSDFVRVAAEEAVEAAEKENPSLLLGHQKSAKGTDDA